MVKHKNRTVRKQRGGMRRSTLATPTELGATAAEEAPSDSTPAESMKAPAAVNEELQPRFAVFHDLLKQPLSGVAELVLLTRGTQQILLLGEIHQHLFCRKKGFTPLVQLIEPFLHRPLNVDFMVEMGNESIYDVDPNDETILDRVRTIAAGAENVNFSDDETDHEKNKPKDILELTRILVQRFVPLQKLSKKKYVVDRSIPNRVSWLEPQTISYDKRFSDGNEFIHQFYQFNKTFHGGFLPDIFKARQEIHNVMEELFPKKNVALFVWIPWCDLSLYSIEEIFVNTSVIDSFFLNSNEATKRLFVADCLEVLMMSKFFRKCKAGNENERGLPISFYVDVFFERSFEWRSLNLFYMYIQRYFVDIFTVCRLFKHRIDPTQFQNVVIYEGQAHLIYQRRILELNGYEVHPITIPLNALCEEPTFKGGKRRNKQTRHRFHVPDRC